MKILCLNPAFSMRAYRQMKALHNRGHEITLFHMGSGESTRYVDIDFIERKLQISFGRYPLSHFPGTLAPSRYRKLVENELERENYDVVHSFSSPDVLGAAAARYSKVPTVFDERDMVTAFRRDVLKNYIPNGLLSFNPIYKLGLSTIYKRVLSIEREANQKSSARVYVSDYTMELARKRHGIREERSILFYNYAMKEDIMEQQRKLSEQDGEVHIIYQGVLSLEGYRQNVLSLLKHIAKMGIHIHIFGIGSKDVISTYKEPENRIEHYHFEGTLHHDELMREITRYDFGLIPFIPIGTESEYIHTMMPNKMFDYLASGVPLLVPESKSLGPFVRRTSTGRCFRDVNDIHSLVSMEPPSFRRGDYVIENHIMELEELYRSIQR